MKAIQLNNAELLQLHRAVIENHELWSEMVNKPTDINGKRTDKCEAHHKVYLKCWTQIRGKIEAEVVRRFGKIPENAEGTNEFYKAMEEKNPFAEL